MLSPGIDTAENRLTTAYQSVLSLDSYAATCTDLRVLQLPEDPDWLPAVREEVKLLRAAAGSWTLARPKVWSDVLVPFSNYTSTFAAFTENAEGGRFQTKEQWVEILEDPILSGLKDAAASAGAAEQLLKDRWSQFDSILPEIETSIQAGWDALAAEEQEMLKLATELGGLLELTKSLGAKITSDGISGGKSYVSSAVSMLYAAGSAAAEASIPILGIVTTVATLGKSFYDIIEDDNQLIAAMKRITQVQSALTEDAQGMALTKATLQILYDLEKQFLSLRDAIPAVVELWSDEEAKVQDAINALNAGAEPSQYLDLQTLGIANTNWQVVMAFVQKIMDTDIQVGAPVTLDIGKAKIVPTLTP